MSQQFQSFARSPLGAFVASPLGARGLGNVVALGDLLLVHDGASFEEIEAPTVIYDSVAQEWIDATDGLSGDLMIHSPRVIGSRLFGINNNRLMVWNPALVEWIPHAEWSFLGAAPAGVPWTSGGSGHGFTQWGDRILAWKASASTMAYFDFESNAWTDITGDLPSSITDAAADNTYILLIDGYYSDDGETWTATDPITLGSPYLADLSGEIFVFGTSPTAFTDEALRWIAGTAGFELVNDVDGIGQIGSSRARAGTIHGSVWHIPGFGPEDGILSDTIELTVSGDTSEPPNTRSATINGVLASVDSVVDPDEPTSAALTAAALEAELESVLPDFEWSRAGAVITGVTSGFRIFSSGPYVGVTVSAFTESRVDGVFRYVGGEFEFVAKGPGSTQTRALASRSQLLVGTAAADAEIAPPNNLYRVSGDEYAAVGISGIGTDDAADSVDALLAMTGVVYLSGIYPDLTVIEPEDGEPFLVGEEITFTGTAIDEIDGDLSAAIEWLNEDTLLHTGATFNKDDLTLGTHPFRARVQNSQDNWDEVLFDVVVKNLYVKITTPADGSSHAAGVIACTGVAKDVEDGDISANIAWTVFDDEFNVIDSDTGASVNFTLAAGVYTIGAEILDSDTNYEFDFVEITVT